MPLLKTCYAPAAQTPPPPATSPPATQEESLIGRFLRNVFASAAHGGDSNAQETARKLIEAYENQNVPRDLYAEAQKLLHNTDKIGNPNVRNEFTNAMVAIHNTPGKYGLPDPYAAATPSPAPPSGPG